MPRRLRRSTTPACVHQAQSSQTCTRQRLHTPERGVHAERHEVHDLVAGFARREHVVRRRRVAAALCVHALGDRGAHDPSAIGTGHVRHQGLQLRHAGEAHAPAHSVVKRLRGHSVGERAATWAATAATATAVATAAGDDVSAGDDVIPRGSAQGTRRCTAPRSEQRPLAASR